MRRNNGRQPFDQMALPPRDLTGYTFASFTVLRYAGRQHIGNDKQRHPLWECRCICGQIRLLKHYPLLRGKPSSCGCQQVRQSSRQSDHPEYSPWCTMIQRCTNPRHDNFRYYGGNGITVCERWRASFELFLADMGPRPSPQHSIERLDNRQGYEPTNCVWGTPAQQARNRRHTVWVTYNGETLCATDWAQRLGVRPSCLLRRLRNGWTIEQAVTMLSGILQSYRSVTHKECAACHLIKSREDFSPNVQKKPTHDPHKSYCKQCTNSMNAVSRKQRVSKH